MRGKIIPVNVFKCEICNQAYLDIIGAEKCCTPKICEDCGVEMPPKHYFVVCDPCGEKRKLERAEKMTLDEYMEKYPDHPLFTVDGRFIPAHEFYCFEDWDSYNDDDVIRPQYLYGATQVYVELNADEIFSIINESVDFEDEVEMFSNDAYAEIQRFCDEWNERNRYDYFEENQKMAVFLGDVPSEGDGAV